MFTLDNALTLAKKMHARYGDAFARQWKGFSINDVAQEFYEDLQNMTPEQIARGLLKMKTHDFPPNVSQFTNWCNNDPKAKWLGAHEAWNVARSSVDFNGNELTVVWTKECAIAFEAVEGMTKLGDKYQIAEAKKIFVERYERMVLEATERGEKPVYVVCYGDDKEQRKTALIEAENAGLLPRGTSEPLIEMTQSPNDAKSEVNNFKTLAQEHLAKLKEALKIKDQEKPLVEEKEEVSIFISPENLTEWADPFDQAEQYVSTLKKEKKPVPLCIGVKDVNI